MEINPKQDIMNALIEHFPLGIILSDTAGDILYVNQTAERLRRIKREKLLGKNILNCHRPNSRPNVRRAMDNIVQKPGTQYKRMVEDKNNGSYYINTYAGVIGPEEKTIGMAVITEDITEKRKMDLERATAYRMLQESDDNLRKRYHELLVTMLETIAKMLEKRDPYTSNHSANVCRYALKIYEQRYGIGVDYEVLKTAADLHDIGKVGIPDSVLKKPGKLTDDEFEIIKEHSQIAEEILKPLDSGSKISAIVRHHHEHFDGSGYPDGLAGDNIPMLSRIIAIADAYDAMRSDRPYRKALPYEVAVGEIQKHAGDQFDPEWTDVFMELAKTGSM